MAAGANPPVRLRQQHLSGRRAQRISIAHNAEGRLCKDTYTPYSHLQYNANLDVVNQAAAQRKDNTDPPTSTTSPPHASNKAPRRRKNRRRRTHQASRAQPYPRPFSCRTPLKKHPLALPSQATPNRNHITLGTTHRKWRHEDGRGGRLPSGLRCTEKVTEEESIGAPQLSYTQSSKLRDLSENSVVCIRSYKKT